MTDRRQSEMDLSQRWRGGRHSFVPPETRIDPSRHGVEEITRAQAAAFLAEHHYLRTTPVAVACAGLFRTAGVRGAELVGVAVFGMPSSNDAVTRRSGLPAAEGIELTRFALRDDVEFNGETYALRRAKDVLRARRPGVRVVLACSDPFPRTDHAGRVVFPGHVGQIYRASSAIAAGRGGPRLSYLCRDGRMLPDRNFSKIRGDRQGAERAAARLVEAGAPERRHGENPSDWLDRALASPAFRKVRHPGVLVFLLPMDGASRRMMQGAKP